MAVALLNKFSLGEIRLLRKVIEGVVLGIVRVTRRAALLPLLLPLLAYIGAKSYLHYSAVSVVEQALATLPAGVQFHVDDIDSHFDGVVDLNGASLLLDGMSLPVRFDRLQLISPSWRDLPVASQFLDQGLLPHRAEFRFNVAESELVRLASATLLPTDTVRRLLGCYQSDTAVKATGDGAVATFMGSIDYRFDPASEYLNAQLKMAAAERFQLEFKADLDIAASQLAHAEFAVDKVGLGGAELQFFNLGSQTQLLNECGATGRSGLVQGSYVARQSKIVKHGLLQQGWVASTELELAYQDYLFMPVQLKLLLSSPYAVRFDRLQNSAAGWDEFNLTLGLNKVASDDQALRWQPRANQLAAAPVALAPSHDPEPSARSERNSDTIAAAPAPLDDAKLQRQLDQTVSYQPSYKQVTTRQLAGLLGAPLKLVTHNGRRIEGVLDALERDQLQLRREVSHGFAIVPVRLALISGMQAYF